MCLGAVIGAGAAFVGDIIAQKYSNPNAPINFKEVGAAALAGAIAGATGGLAAAPEAILTLGGETTLATGSATVLGVSGASAGTVIGGIAERSINTGSVDEATNNPNEMVKDAATGTLSEFGAQGIEQITEKAAGGAVRSFEKQVGRASTANKQAKIVSRLNKAQRKLDQKVRTASATASTGQEAAQGINHDPNKDRPKQKDSRD
jgi:hypothetical protein